MTPVVGYIYNYLSETSKDFPQVNFKYGYNTTIRTHIIILSPESQFESNEKLDDSWIPFSFAFKAKFPEEEIAFIPPSSSLSSIAVEFEFNSILLDYYFSCLYAELSEKELKYSFPTTLISTTIFNTSLKMLNYPEQIIERNLEEETIKNSYQLAA
jgi:hypothetical protein